MNPIFVGLIAIPLMIGLLFGEKRNYIPLILAFKIPLSTLFVLVALLGPSPLQQYYFWVVAGLILGVIGDICLALRGNTVFRAGLVAFLLGHILYVIAFTYLIFMDKTAFQSIAHNGTFILIGFSVISFTSAIIFKILRPHVGSMLVPVALYVIVISVMVLAAWVVYFNPLLNSGGTAMMLSGAVLFYISDLFVARNRFVAPSFINRLLGLPAYYLGQFLIAFSVRWMI